MPVLELMEIVMAEKYEQEAKRIARKFYGKDWQRLSGRLRQEIYQMAVSSVNSQKGEIPTLGQKGENSGEGWIVEDAKDELNP